MNPILMQDREKILDMLMWRIINTTVRTPEELVAAMTVEALPYEAIPSKWLEAVKGFRRLNAFSRLASCRRLWK